MRLRPTPRRLLRHLVLAVFVAAASTVVVRLVESDRAVFLASMASAYVGLALLGLTLLLGPWNILRQRPNPVSTHLRRDVGIWAGVVGLFHVAAGLQVHLPGAMEGYFLFPPDRGGLPLRYDPFGLANWTGLGAAVVVLVLLTLSNDLSLRKLGPDRWKKVQRWNYALFALVVGHGLIYQLVEGRPAPWVVVLGAGALVVVVLQVAGRWARRRTG